MSDCTSQQVIPMMTPDKPQIYQAEGKNGPGRYYYLETRKIVPGQILRGGGNNTKFDLTKYEVVARPKAKQSARRTAIDYSKIREEEPVVCKKVTLLEIETIAMRNEWKLSARCKRAFSVWGKNAEELNNVLVGYKEKYPDCNYLDYDVKSNAIHPKWRDIELPGTPATPSEE